MPLFKLFHFINCPSVEAINAAAEIFYFTGRIPITLLSSDAVFENLTKSLDKSIGRLWCSEKVMRNIRCFGNIARCGKWPCLSQKLSSTRL